MTTSTIPTREEMDILIDEMCRNTQFNWNNEIQEEERTYLRGYEPWNSSIYSHLDERDTYIIRILPDWDEEEGVTYEEWRDEHLPEHLSCLLNDDRDEDRQLGTTWEVETLKTGNYWSLFRVVYH